MSGFKAKTIKSIISKKIDKWLETIDDVPLREKAARSTIVTGGCITSMLLGEDVNDFDLYMRDHDTTLQIAQYYVKKFQDVSTHTTPLEVTDEDGRIKIVVKSSGVAYVDENAVDPETIEESYHKAEEKSLEPSEQKYKPTFLTTNAITLSDKIQIVLRFYGEPDQIHENYDFVHCTSYWTSWDKKLVLRPEALETILSKELRYIGSKYPICSMVRVRKFVQRGWKINAGQILKMAMQISQLDLEDLNVLEDQLTGVDTAYFLQLIQRLKEKDPEKVDAAYLIEIIDRIF
jgi:hypothetical protein